jgi:hypothetical protein
MNESLSQYESYADINKRRRNYYKICTFACIIVPLAVTVSVTLAISIIYNTCVVFEYGNQKIKLMDGCTERVKMGVNQHHIDPTSYSYFLHTKMCNHGVFDNIILLNVFVLVSALVLIAALINLCISPFIKLGCCGQR